ncbi:MAG TPA: DUF262 domain-containing protein [Chitinophagales bacterium]|nr:DUF262 domain-containing protein [Chitinophagales bacterium]
MEKGKTLDIVDLMTLNLLNPQQDGVEQERIDPKVKLMEKPFDPSFISIDTKTPSLDTLIDRIRHNEVELNTENYFQRQGDLWDDEKQSRLIESILIRFPLPAFYFDGTDKNKWLIVDGLQRLSSIKNFVVNKTLKLTNLEFLTHLHGKGYDDLDRDLQRIIKESQVVVYIINPGTPNDVKFNIFKRINTGGLILETQEIRHALFQGAPSRFVFALARIKEFISATGHSIKAHRMLDRDFATRFLSFYHFGFKNYVPDLDTFMSRTMAAVYEFSEEKKKEITDAFRASMILNEKIFEKHAFRKFEKLSDGKKPINKALFDVFSVSFAELSKEEANELKKNKKQFISDFVDLLFHDKNNEFFWTVTSSTSDKNRVNYRFRKVNELIQKTIS